MINTFVRQIYLYKDKIIILFNFATPPDKPKLTVEENIKIAEQINSALSKTNGSRIKLPSAPKKTVSFETAFLFYLDILKREKFLYDNIYFAIIFLILLRKQNKSQVLKGTHAKSLP